MSVAASTPRGSDPSSPSLGHPLDRADLPPKVSSSPSPPNEPPAEAWRERAEAAETLVQYRSDELRAEMARTETAWREVRLLRVALRFGLAEADVDLFLRDVDEDDVERVAQVAAERLRVR